MDPRTRKPDPVAVADLAYKKLLKTYNNAKYEDEGKSMFDYDATSFNQFEYIHTYLSIHAGHIHAGNSVKTLL